jgi:hypothetical protein
MLPYPEGPPQRLNKNEEFVKLRLHSVLTWLFLAAAAATAQDAAQNPAQPPPPTPSTTPEPQQPSPTLAPPRELPSTVNTGGGFSLEPMYWMPRGLPKVRQGAANFQVDPGNFDYNSRPDRAFGGRVSFPIGTNGTLRGSYIQTKSHGASTSPIDLNLFGGSVLKDDFLGTYYKIEAVKLSYEYLTYFWKKKSSEVRLKTLWEVQRISVSNEIDDFVPQADGTFNPTSAMGTKSVFLPTFGLGLEQTLSRHFRWEARGSGFGLPHRADIGDAEADIALRVGHFEVLAGGRFLHFKTSPKSEQYNVGSIYGPFFSIRYYGKKQ